MSLVTNPQILKHLYCRLFNYHYIVKNNITEFVREYHCLDDGRELTTSDQGELIPLTNKTSEINKDLKKLYSKRRQIKEKVY